MRLVACSGLTLLGLVGCRGAGNLTPPTLRDPYSQYLANGIGSRDPLGACTTAPFDLGSTERQPIRRLQLGLFLPTAFVIGPRELPVDSLPHPARTRSLGWNGWLPGLYLEPVWYRWTRADRVPSGAVNPPTTVLQLSQRRGYPPFLAQPPWTIAEAGECLLPLKGRTARVFRFALKHPSQSTQWGVLAYWRGRPNDGWLAMLGLGPEPAVQAELVELIRRHEP